jgi:protein-S-isoprenylcysteine O-methyltransferase Ste14
MVELLIYYIITIAFLVFGGITFVSLFFKTASYGRHAKKGIDYRIAWTVMEAVPLIVFVLCYGIGDRLTSIVPIFFLLLFAVHYTNRAFIFPFITRGKERIPFSIMATAVLFNSVNGYLHGRWFFTLVPEYSADWFLSPQFIIGIAIFIIGMLINLHSDHILRNLRKPGETEYKIPYGGVFRWVSCGNYLGEVVEWIGWAILTWSLPGLVFALWVMANLVPRARSHHKWYHEKFPDYPPERKAIFPFLF